LKFNEAVYNLRTSAVITVAIISLRSRWTRYCTVVGGVRNAYRILVWKSRVISRDECISTGCSFAQINFGNKILMLLKVPGCTQNHIEFIIPCVRKVAVHLGYGINP
jgi:hypothetical protein